MLQGPIPLIESCIQAHEFDVDILIRRRVPEDLFQGVHGGRRLSGLFIEVRKTEVERHEALGERLAVFCNPVFVSILRKEIARIQADGLLEKLDVPGRFRRIRGAPERVHIDPQ